MIDNLAYQILIIPCFGHSMVCSFTTGIHDYLRTALHTAISRSFPDISILPESIPLLFKSPLPDADLNTPVALRIASLKNIPPGRAALDLISCFGWDSRFVEPDPGLCRTLFSGFISFRTSAALQYSALKSAAGNRTVRLGQDCSGNGYFKVGQLLKETAQLLKHAEKTLPLANGLEPAHFDLLDLPDERKLIRLIAVSQTDEIHSRGAAGYFLQMFNPGLSRYLKTVPVFSPDNELAFSRAMLIRACHNRIFSLI